MGCVARRGVARGGVGCGVEGLGDGDRWVSGVAWVAAACWLHAGLATSPMPWMCRPAQGYLCGKALCSMLINPTQPNPSQPNPSLAPAAGG